MTQYQNIQLNVAGPSYQSRSRPLASQHTKNYYQTIVEEGKEQFVLHPFPGLKKVGDGVGAGADRGMNNFNEIGYRVCGNTLYRFDKLGVHTAISGSIPGSRRLIIDNDGDNLILVGEDGQFIYDGTNPVTSITDVNIVGSTSVTFINSQMVYGNPVTDLFVMANPNNPDTASGLNQSSPESKPDKLVRPYAFKQNVYMFGQRTVEPYWNSGSGNPPLA